LGGGSGEGAGGTTTRFGAGVVQYQRRKITAKMPNLEKSLWEGSFNGGGG